MQSIKARRQENKCYLISEVKTMNKFEPPQEALKRRPMPAWPWPARAPRKLLKLSVLDDDDMASAVVPSVTVVLEGRSICQRIHLHKHAGYESLAVALRRMFVDVEGDDGGAGGSRVDGLDLTNAVPGYMVAYEDMEDDLLLAGDLNWKDFVRVVKRIRIIPAKTGCRKSFGENNKSKIYSRMRLDLGGCEEDDDEDDN